MVGRASVWPSWPVDPGRSAGPAPHRPPRGAITRTRVPGSTRAGDRLTPSYSPPCRLAATDLQTTGHASTAPPATRCGSLIFPSSVHALTHCTHPPGYSRVCVNIARKLAASSRVQIRLRRRIHAFLVSGSSRMRCKNVF
ncbi:unnamed protein product [Parnassius apollo]|uniref:(apollo) hypothetical protein n=1 Tax=Parnassius apollo TaxID=110799 RepID=A0A8S3WKR8_PARAO|nr:unnamed protein product [Parnassius apollo]